jgi:long-subunit fatty acid transport protein
MRLSFPCPVLALLLGGLMALVPATAGAQSAADALFFSQRLPATGPRLTALGGASLAGVADAGALFSNPAGLGYFQASELGGSFRTLLTSDEASYETFFRPEPEEDIESFGRTLNTQTATDYALGNASLVYDVATERGALVFGFALNETRPFDREVDIQNQNELSSITDFFLPTNSEIRVEPVTNDDGETEYVIEFDPNNDDRIERPLSFAAFEAFAIDFIPALFEAGASEAGSFVPSIAPGTRFVQVGDLSESGALREVNLGGAFEASRGLMLGLSANISYGNYGFRSLFEEVDSQDQNDGVNFTTIEVQGPDSTTVVDVRTLDVGRIRLTQTQDLDFSGFSVRAGLSATVVPGVRAGLTIETPTWYNLDETSDLVVATTFDDGSQSVYGDDPAEDVGRTRFDYEIRTPWRIGGGLSARVADVRLLVDAVFVDWTQLELDDADGSGLSGIELENATIEDTFDPVLNTRVGLEYQPGPLALRAGFAYQPSPVTFSELSTARFGVGSSLNLRGLGEVDDPSRTTLSAGIGYTFNDDLTLDLTWTQQRFEDRTLPYVSQNASYINEEVVRNQVLIGLRYRF